MSASRREFLAILGALGGAAALVGAGCGDDGEGGPAGRDAGGGGSCTTTSVSIGGNHGHALTVPVSDVTAGVMRSYDITGSATHDHQVTLTAAHFATLAGGGSVMVTSTSTGHTHTLTVSCA